MIAFVYLSDNPASSASNDQQSHGRSKRDAPRADQASAAVPTPGLPVQAVIASLEVPPPLISSTSTLPTRPLFTSRRPPLLPQPPLSTGSSYIPRGGRGTRDRGWRCGQGTGRGQGGHAAHSTVTAQRAHSRGGRGRGSRGRPTPYQASSMAS